MAKNSKNLKNLKGKELQVFCFFFLLFLVIYFAALLYLSSFFLLMDQILTKTVSALKEIHVHMGLDREQLEHEHLVRMKH